MKRIRDGVCILVALGSIALAAWQPAIATGHPDLALPSKAIKQVDESVPQPIDRAVFSAPLVKA